MRAQVGAPSAAADDAPGVTAAGAASPAVPRPRLRLRLPSTEQAQVELDRPTVTRATAKQLLSVCAPPAESRVAASAATPAAARGAPPSG